MAASRHVPLRFTPFHSSRAPDTQGDEALARRLQQQEEDGLPSRSLPGTSSLSADAALAAALQSDEEAAAAALASARGASRGGLRVQEPRQANTSGAMSDEELAALLQREENARARRDDDDTEDSEVVVQPQRRSRGDPHSLAETARICAHCLPGMCGCGAQVDPKVGAMSGCIAGCQLAACFGLGKFLICACMLGGSILGYSCSGGSRRLLGGSGWRRARNGYDSDSDTGSEDEAPYQGLDAAVISSRTVDHVYRGTVIRDASAPTASTGSTTAATTLGQAEDNKCMVCMEMFADGEVLRTLPCLHRYHSRCVDEWLRRHPTCPICKRDITDNSAPPPEPRHRESNARAGPRAARALTSVVQRAGRAVLGSRASR